MNYLKRLFTFVVKEDGTVDGKVIMYNTPETIEVPSTGTFKTITTSFNWITYYRTWLCNCIQKL